MNSTNPNSGLEYYKKQKISRHCEERGDAATQGLQANSQESSQGFLAVTKIPPLAPGLPRTQPLRDFWALAMTIPCRYLTQNSGYYNTTEEFLRIP